MQEWANRLELILYQSYGENTIIDKNLSKLDFLLILYIFELKYQETNLENFKV